MGNPSEYLSKPWLQSYHKDVPSEVEIPGESLIELFDEYTTTYANQTAIIFYGNKISFKQLREQVDRFASALSQLGVKKGDKVACKVWAELR